MGSISAVYIGSISAVYMGSTSAERQSKRTVLEFKEYWKVQQVVHKYKVREKFQ